MSIIQDRFKSLPVKKVSLWPRWSKEALISRKNELGTKAFNRGYRHEALTDEDLTFPHFKLIMQFGFGPEVIGYNWPCFGGIDISSTSRPGSVIATAAVDPATGKKYPKELRIGAWDSPTFVAEILDCYNIHRHQVMFVENNGVQDMLRQQTLEKGAYVPVEGYLTGNQKWNPDIGLPSLDVEFENKSWFLPMNYVDGHEDGCNCNWCRFIAEFQAHPQHKTTDVVMAFWFVREAIRLRWGSSVYYEEEPYEEGVFEYG